MFVEIESNSVANVAVRGAVSCVANVGRSLFRGSGFRG
jgi:hypothetical protein